MTGLTDLTLRDALAGLKSREFSAVELARAHIDAIAAARPLNALTGRAALAFAPVPRLTHALHTKERWHVHRCGDRAQGRQARADR